MVSEFVLQKPRGGAAKKGKKKQNEHSRSRYTPDLLCRWSIQPRSSAIRHSASAACFQTSKMADSYNFLSLYTILYIIAYAAGHVMIKRRKKQSRLVTGSKKTRCYPWHVAKRWGQAGEGQLGDCPSDPSIFIKQTTKISQQTSSYWTD